MPTVVAALRERLAKQQPRVGVRQAKTRDAALEAAQRWLDVAAEEIEGFDADAIWAGNRLGEQLLRKFSG
jgi:hypothetical protein